MGAQLVAHVYTTWAHLPDRPFRLLCHMALVCLDDDTEPLYWGGREAMAQALGLEPGLDSSHTMVKRARRMLEEAGAIDCVRTGRAGKRSEYVLLVRRLSTVARLGGTQMTPSGGTQMTPSGGTQMTPSGGTQMTPSGGTQMTPLGTTEETTEEYRRTDHLVPKARLRRTYPQAAETA